MDELNELSMMEKLEVYRRVLRKRILRGLVTLPEMAMFNFVDEWLAFARQWARELAA